MVAIELTREMVAWATRETLWIVIWATLAIMALTGITMRWERKYPDDRDGWDQMR